MTLLFIVFPIIMPSEGMMTAFVYFDLFCLIPMNIKNALNSLLLINILGYVASGDQWIISDDAKGRQSECT